MAERPPPTTPAESRLVRQLQTRWFKPAEQKRKAMWKDALRAHVGDDGGVIWRGLLEIAQGAAWVPRLEDGREGPPQLPTTADRIAAYRFLAEALFGKAPTQEKIAEAERAAAENEDLQLLSDEELESRVRKALFNREESVLGAGLPEDPP